MTHAETTMTDAAARMGPQIEQRPGPHPEGSGLKEDYLMSNESEGGEVDKPTHLQKLMLAKRETKRATESMGPRMKRRQKHDYEVGQRKYDESRDNEEAESMNEETSAGAPPRVQARGRDAAMQTKTATRTDRRPTRRRGESLAAVRPPDGDTIGSRVEGAAREGLTAPEVLALALLALLFLVMLGTLFVFSFVYVLVLLVLPGLGMLLLWII